MYADVPERFGWVGLGAMGYPMASRLARKLPASSKLFIYDIDAEVTKKFRDALINLAGPQIAIMSSAKEVAESSDCFISIVPEGAHVRAVYLTPERGALAAFPGCKLFIDCSTIDVKTSLEIGQAISTSHPTSRFFDAPVSGGTAGAEKGALTFMVGAAPNDPSYHLLEHIFSFMGTSVYPVGGPSLGLAAKLSNNYLSATIALATSEAMNLGMRLGVDPKILSECFRTGSGSNYVNNTCNPVPGVCPDAVTSRGYEGGFKVQLMKKDMSLAIEAAKEVNAKLVLADAGFSAYSAAAEDPRCKNKDSRVVYRWLGGVEPEVKR
ncbi:hypothetical protein D9757_000543 [Collybiopsis confluens]|uniref:3-hydroxyisobutyrate dehydrogenase n=1 Tax=Collybiopsis confluens TaxID=2823264 RepID=A0A8H5I1J3_9AGAR|nr:hypothetical protein D9757_000543 [Collybiopsis confluens]